MHFLLLDSVPINLSAEMIDFPPQPGTILGARDTALNKTNQSLCLEGAYCIPTGEKATKVKTWHRIPAVGEGQAEKWWEVGSQGRAWR